MTYDLRTCRERQDEELARHAEALDNLFGIAAKLAQADERNGAAINDLLLLTGHAQAATERLTRDLAALQKRVSALAYALTPEPDDVCYMILERVRDDALDDDLAPRTATPNQTYSWLPGDAWSQYCAAVDAAEELP